MSAIVNAKARNLYEKLSASQLEVLSLYEQVLMRWSKRLNLISVSNTKDLWSRHIGDAIQLTNYIPGKEARIIDIGSGAGMPGLVLAGLGYTNVALVEADKRKCVFLREAAREMSITVEVINKRVERLNPLHADIVVARACSDMQTLLAWSLRHLNNKGSLCFLKGKSILSELPFANSESMEYCLFNSLVDPSGVIVMIKNVKSAEQ